MSTALAQHEIISAHGFTAGLPGWPCGNSRPFATDPYARDHSGIFSALVALSNRFPATKRLCVEDGLHFANDHRFAEDHADLAAT
jgi:hypothetical protein